MNVFRLDAVTPWLFLNGKEVHTGIGTLGPALTVDVDIHHVVLAHRRSKSVPVRARFANIFSP